MTFFVYMRFAVNVKQTVTVASNPSGTCVARRRHDTTATLSRGAWALWRLHRRRRGGVASPRRRRRDRALSLCHAATTAPTRSEMARNPKRNHAHGREMVTSLMDTTGRRETHVRDNNTNHEDEGRHRVLAHAQRRREERDAQREGDRGDDLDEVVDLFIYWRLLGFLC